MPRNAIAKARTRTDTGRPDAGVFDLPDCRECRTFRNAHFRAVADHRTSADYMRIRAGQEGDRLWVERHLVAAVELDTMSETVDALNAEHERLMRENERLMREVVRLTAALAEAKHQ